MVVDENVAALVLGQGLGSGNFDWRDLRGMGKMRFALIEERARPLKRGDWIMDASPRISVEALQTFLHGRVNDIAQTLADAVNGARPGHLINDSEELVRVAMDELRRAAFEAAIQEKVDAAEAAFPPSGGPGDGSKET